VEWKGTRDAKSFHTRAAGGESSWGKLIPISEKKVYDRRTIPRDLFGDDHSPLGLLSHGSRQRVKKKSDSGQQKALGRRK